MKSKKTFLAIVLTAASIWASPAGDFYFHPVAGIDVVWGAPTNLPNSLPIYETSPQNFAPSVISNAVSLASFTEKDLVISNRNIIRYQDKKGDKWTRFLNILPEDSQILYHQRTGPTGPAKDVPDEQEVSKLAFEYLASFGINRSQVCELPENRKVELCPGSTNVCSRGVFLTRTVAGSGVRGTGFQIDFGSHGQIRDFYLCWPTWSGSGSRPIVTVPQIIQWLKDGRMLPTEKELTNKAKMQDLEQATRLLVTSFEIHYGQGRFGELPSAENEKMVSPFGVLKGTAYLENTNIDFTLYAPIF